MAEAASKVPVEVKKGSALEAWRPFETLHRAVDRLFEDFERNLRQPPFRRLVPDIEPFWRRGRAAVPAVDIAESDKAYEITAELPGMDEKNIEVKLVDGDLTIKGEKEEEKEEKERDYYLHERQFGSFERCFPVPEGVDTGKIEASFKKGVLTVTLPKKPEARGSQKKIEVKAA